MNCPASVFQYAVILLATAYKKIICAPCLDLWPNPVEPHPQEPGRALAVSTPAGTGSP